MEEKRIKQVKKMIGARKLIAERMATSLRDYPQGTGCKKICMDEILALKDELKKQNENVSVTSILIKLAAAALQENPQLNSAVINNELIIYDSVNIGVGIGLPEGIMLVVIKEAQDKDIFQISEELQRLITQLKSRKINFKDMQGSTFTLSNIGMFDLDEVTPFLSPPETAILSVGATRKMHVVNDDDTTSIKRMATFCTTVNHAAVDGMHGGKFLMTFTKLANKPKEYMGL
ncbi:hypothetical protein GOM49_05360 [Clostridium bovifaecis]|uniref:2-oxoacid dehydrogenase acyltransferase catalytic domain-containing protein n=1 Tax=Clostridium bovifaecis TaxID=2184719 RepID=A0A6I6F025_9CLOT|nr:hypothetical protein GOM49_05360 [Clostridium bovifaecis]